MLDNECTFDAVILQGMKYDAHASQLARAVRQSASWPAEPADRAAWLRVDVSAFLIEAQTGSSRTTLPTSSEVGRARQQLAQCQQPELAAHMPADFVIGATTMFLSQSGMQSLATEMLQAGALLEAAMLRLATRGDRCALLPALPLVHTDCEFVPGTAFSVDRLVYMCSYIPFQTYCAGDTRQQQRAHDLASVLLPRISQLVRQGHLNGDFAIHCCMLSLAPFFDRVDELRAWLADFEQLLPFCAGASVGRSYILAQRQYLHYMEGDLSLAQHIQALQSQSSQDGVASLYVGAASAAHTGELLSVHVDHFMSFLVVLTGALMAFHGSCLDSAEAMLKSIVLRQVNRMALHLPACVLADAGMVALAWIAHHRGDTSAADGYLSHAINAWRLVWLHSTRNIGLGNITGMPPAAVLLLRRGQGDQAAALVAEFLKFPNWTAAVRDASPLFGTCCYVRGQLALSAGDAAAARDHLARALAALRGPKHWLWADCERAHAAALSAGQNQ